MRIRAMLRSIFHTLFICPLPFFLLFFLLFVLKNLVMSLSSPNLATMTVASSDPDNYTNILHGISAVITALGLVGFALSYINTAKAYRVKGILMEDVISQGYPWYGLIFLDHGGFALLGLYSCEVNILFSAQACLIGVLMCTIYSLLMAYSIVFSPKGRNHLVTWYINALLRKELPSKRSIRTAYQLGRYIGERYQADDIQIGRHRQSDQEDELMLISTLHLLMPETSQATHKIWPPQFAQRTQRANQRNCVKKSEPSWEGALPADDIQIGRHRQSDQEDELMLISTLHLLMPETSQATHKIWPPQFAQRAQRANQRNCIKKSEPSWEGALPAVFDKMFPNSLGSHPEYAFFTLAAKNGHAFQDNVRHCATLWDNLLRPVERESLRAELAVDVFWCAQQTAALCCGLVYYLYSTYIQFTGEEGWQTCARFLKQISNIAQSSSGEQQRPQREKVLRCSMDMMLLFFCLACLQEANSYIQGLCPLFQTLLSGERQYNGSISCHIPLDPLCFTRYLYFAYVLFQSLTMLHVHIPSRSELYRQIPVIVTAMRRCFTDNI